VATPEDGLDIGVVEFVIVGLNGAFQLLLRLLVLLELGLHKLLLFGLLGLKLSNAPLVVDVAQATTREISARLKIVVFLCFRLYRSQQRTKAALPTS